MTADAPVRPTAAPVAVTPSTTDEEIIRIDEATVRFGELVAVNQISLSVPRGTILGVIGPSGAGKTTTIRLLTGGLLPTEGRVRVLGEEPRRFRRRTRERIGYMPQQFTLYPDLTAGENIDFVASLFGMLWLSRRRAVRRVLEIVDLWDARGRRAADLSGGQQRRLELACALVHDPELLFLDEPTAGIDPMLRSRIWDELHRLKAAGRTLLVTTQYVNEAEECDSVALIAQGQLVALATPDDLRREATGGDVIEVDTASAFDGERLSQLPDVRRVSQTAPRSFHVVVDDAGAATPGVVAAIGEAGGEVVSAREYRLSFDEIFTELVERNRRRLEAGEEAEAAHEENVAEAAALVDHEIERRRRDAGTVSLDARAEAVETRQAERAAENETVATPEPEAASTDRAAVLPRAADTTAAAPDTAAPAPDTAAPAPDAPLDDPVDQAPDPVERRAIDRELDR